jgi:hypothetical protein
LTPEYTGRAVAFYPYMGISRRKGHPAVLLLATLASVALVLGGWAGAQASAKPATGRHELTASQTQRLLALVATARADATAHKAKAVFSTLSDFTSYVQSLRASGSIDGATAVKLLLRARITESQAAAQLQISPTSTTAEGDATRTVTSGAPAQQGTQNNPATQATTAGPTGAKPAPPVNPPATPPVNQPAAAQTVAAAINAWWAAETAGLHNGAGWHHGYRRSGNGQPGPGQSGDRHYGHGGQGSGGGGNS